MGVISSGFSLPQAEKLVHYIDLNNPKCNKSSNTNPYAFNDMLVRQFSSDGLSSDEKYLWRARRGIYNDPNNNYEFHLTTSISYPNLVTNYLDFSRLVGLPRGDRWINCATQEDGYNDVNSTNKLFLNWWNPEGFTFTIWLRPQPETSDSADQRILFRQKSSGGNGPYLMQWNLANEKITLNPGVATNTNAGSGNGGSNFEIINASDNIIAETTKWTCLTVAGKPRTIQDSNEGVPEIDVYVNGEKDFRLNSRRLFGWSIPGLNAGNEFNGIGATRWVGDGSYGVGGNHSSFEGDIGPLIMWETLLTDDEIKSAYEHTKKTAIYKNPGDLQYQANP